MKIKITLVILAFALSLLSLGFGEEALKGGLPPQRDFHLFLLAGQSNMAGRGMVSYEDQIIHPRIFMLSKDGKWKPALDPIHYDKSIAGVGLAKTFAIHLTQLDSNIAIGLVPAACGGSPISTWEPGGYHDQTKSHPYDDSISRIQRAMDDGVIKGILWHQGEADSKQLLAPLYKNNLKNLIHRFRYDLNARDVPFIIGQLGQFLENPWDEYKEVVNQAHIDLAKEMYLVGFVSSDGLKCKSDKVHFDTKSLKEFGYRYAEEYLNQRIQK